MNSIITLGDMEMAVQGRVLSLTYSPKSVHRSGRIIPQRIYIVVGFHTMDVRHYVAWGRLADVCSFNLHKGKEVHILAKLSNKKILNDGAVAYTRTVKRVFYGESGNYKNECLEELLTEMDPLSAFTTFKAMMNYGYQGSRTFGNAVVNNPV